MSLSDYASRGASSYSSTAAAASGISHGGHMNGYAEGDARGGAALDSICSAAPNSTAAATTTNATTTYQGIISMATLSNIGNSCYLNSVVYTLRFTPNFLHNLHHLVEDINYVSQMHQNGVRRAKTSSLGRNQSSGGGGGGGHAYANGPLSGAGVASGSRSMSNKDLLAMANGGVNGHAGLSNGYAVANGHLLMNGGDASTQLKCHRQTATEKLHELYQSLARNENLHLNHNNNHHNHHHNHHHLDPYQPVPLLNAIQDVSSTFEGNQQQDAHEFLMCILDSIRETCQTLNKTFAESLKFQRTMNGVAQMGCSDSEPSNGTNAALQSSTGSQNSNNSNGGSSGSSVPFKNILFLNLKRKSKRKEEKQITSATTTSTSGNASLPPTGLGPFPVGASKGTASTGTGKISDISIDSTATMKHSLGDSPALNGSPDKDADQVHVNGSSTQSAATESCSPSTSPTTTTNTDVSSSTPPLTTEKEQNNNEKAPKLDSDFFSADFEGVTVSTTKCLSCETETEQKETMIDLSIPISGHESLDALENPQAFFQSSCITKEYFRGCNKYRCEKCSAYTEAIRSISFEVLPRLLVIQLKRFSGGMEKINSYIPTPFVLQCFCRKCCALAEDKKLHVYRLYSVITHVGATMSAGHYITYTSSLECYCDYLDCEKADVERRWAKTMLSQCTPHTNNNSSSVVLANGGALSNGGVGLDCDLTDGKLTGVTNLSNPGHQNQSQQQQEKVGSNLIEKIKKNRLFKNKSMSSSSSGGASAGVKAKFAMGQAQETAAAAAQQSSETMTNSQNEVLERNRLEAAERPQLIGVNGYQPQVCRSMNCCTIKGKGQFLVKQVANCAENNTATTTMTSGSSTTASCAADGNLYCNNPGHHSKFGGGAGESNSSSNSNYSGADGLEGANLTTSISSSGSSATSGSGKLQNGTLANGGRARGGSSAGTGANLSDEPIWYMCDDDKIKPMPQHEFKELLSSNRKIAITPYLLFYARSDL